MVNEPTRTGAWLLSLFVAGCGGDLAGAGLADAGDLPDLGDPGGEDAMPPSDDADPAGPPYPLVMVHGMGGFKNIGPIDYFYGIPDVLRRDGHDVWISAHDPINDSEVRGQEVRHFVETVLLATGKRKVNLIGHSQGGFEVRYVASTIGDRVGAVVTVASPMLGDPVADLVTKAGPGWQDAAAALLNLYGAVNGYDSNAQVQIAQLSTDGASAFFTRHPDDDRVAYYSIAGRSAGSLGEPDCLGPRIAPFVSKWNNQLDTIDPILSIPSAILDQLTPKPVHDGLVTVASARHGTFLGCIPADHMDEVNQLLGDSPGAGNSFDAVQFYRDLAAFLVEQGF